MALKMQSLGVKNYGLIKGCVRIMINTIKNWIISNNFLQELWYYFMQVLNYVKYFMLYSCIVLSIICLICIFFNLPFSIHITW